jgi:hypothetical protein
MLITDKFVILNFPKTGSSFVRETLKKVHNYNSLLNRVLRYVWGKDRSGLVELMLPHIDQDRVYKQRGPHGVYRQIPRADRHKVVATVIRNPFSRYVSAYLYGFWQRKFANLFPEQIKQDYPNFPDLSFAEYMALVNDLGAKNRLQGVQPQLELGVMSVQFVQFYFSEPRWILANMDEAYIVQRKYEADMPTIRFLRQENLNHEFYAFLSQQGYAANEIDFIVDAERVNVSPRQRDQQRLRDFYTPELAQMLRERDSLLFSLFPEYADTLG